jgi:hypothetical protein
MSFSVRRIHSLPKSAYLFLSLGTLASCQEKETPRAALVVPTAYDAATYDANAATQLAVANRLVALTDEAKKGRVVTNKVTADALNTLFTTGTPSLKSVATTYYAGRLEGANGWLAELAKGSSFTYTPGVPVANGNGGVFAGYLFDENGLEMEQLIEKGQFASTLYKHATDLFSGAMTPATADQAAAVMGFSPLFPNTTTATKTPRVDRLIATYAARRDKNDGNGLYSLIKNDFTKLQAALKAGDAYKTEQQEAINGIKLNVEKVNAATVINYCYAVIATMSKTTTTDAEKGASLHAYGEAVGFMHGWRTLPQQHKKITDAQIDEILVLLKAPATGTPESYKFITAPAAELPKLQEIITKLKGIYGFTDAQLEDFKSNWITVQGR